MNECTSNVLPLREALVNHPRMAWQDVAARWEELGYTGGPSLTSATAEFDAFCRLLESEGVVLRHLEASAGPDSIYTHDPVVSVGRGLVLCRMGKPAREAEPEAVFRWAVSNSLPVVGRIEAPGLLEGGDVIWLDGSTVAVGIGFRSNAEGARQLGVLAGVDVVEVPLPYWNGPSDILHLMSLISPIAEDLALVHRRLLPVPFLEELSRRGIQPAVLPEDEYDTMGCNVLALAPRVCVMLEGNPRTRALLESHGCRVLTYRGREISLKGQGGPTCLTRPLVRVDARQQASTGMP